jgi:hypothetical protein
MPPLAIADVSPQGAHRRLPSQSGFGKPPHSIAWSARTRSDFASLSPIAFALVGLTTRSNLVGCSTGISPGLIPFGILSTTSAARGALVVYDPMSAAREN